MKHLVILLNYNRSRLENPIYHKFSRNPADRRDTALLFLARPIEERELLHEVANLRRREKEHPSDVTFHLCASFDHADESSSLIQTARLVRRLFPADASHRYRTFAYAWMPDVKSADAKTIKTVWNNLAATNNAAAEHADFHIFSQVFLYHDATQQSLADFLYEVSHYAISIEQEPDRDAASERFPAIFGTFNTIGISYPENDVRTYLQKLYVATLLNCSLPDAFPTTAETCNAVAHHILAPLPIQNGRICLQEETFLNLDTSRPTQWKPVADFWHDCAESESQGMNDIPHREWLNRIRQRMDAIAQSRFRDVGIDYFFQLQDKKTSDYATVLHDIVRQEFIRVIQAHPYSPETQKTILRAIVNVLQQKVLELQNCAAQTEQALADTERRLSDICGRWNSAGFFARLRKKDDLILTEFIQQAAILYTQKTQLPGFRFAVKLLNELIPSVQGLLDDIEQSRRLLDEAMLMANNEADDALARLNVGQFSRQQIEMARQQLPQDSGYFLDQYRHIVTFIFGGTASANGEDLAARINAQFAREIDSYLKERIRIKTLPPVIMQSITDRMDSLYAEKGGLPAFIGHLKRHTPLSLQLKENNIADNFVLISPAATNDETLTHIVTDDSSHIQMLHLQQGVRLTDLDGFSGQRMVFEPYIF